MAIVLETRDKRGDKEKMTKKKKKKRENGV